EDRRRLLLRLEETEPGAPSALETPVHRWLDELAGLAIALAERVAVAVQARSRRWPVEWPGDRRDTSMTLREEIRRRFATASAKKRSLTSVVTIPSVCVRLEDRLRATALGT